jgi:hypothetical protein
MRSRSVLAELSAVRVAASISSALFVATSGPLRGVFQRHTAPNSSRV